MSQSTEIHHNLIWIENTSAECQVVHEESTTSGSTATFMGSEISSLNIPNMQMFDRYLDILYINIFNLCDLILNE